MGLAEKFKKVLNPETEDESYADDPYYNNFDGEGDNAHYEMPEEGTDLFDMPQSNGAAQSYNGIGLSSGSAIEMKVVKPESFKNVGQIADHLISGRTVVLNLENTNRETARRLIDFLSGVTYSMSGQIKRIASNAYVITPSNVEVSDADNTVEQEQPQQQQEQPRRHGAGASITDYYNDL